MTISEYVLVTGGAGYIGSVLTGKLIEKGYKVRVLDSLIYGSAGISKHLSDKSIELIPADIRNENILQKAVEGIDYVIHLAAIVGEPLCNKIPEAARQINEYATINLLKFCKKSKVKRFIFASTCSNYGSSSTAVNEKSPLHTLSLYSKSKVRSEEAVLSYTESNFESCVLRFATAFGISPRMRFDLLLHEFIRDAFVNNKIVIFGPNYWRPLVHVIDIANACILALEKPEKMVSGEIYNVGANTQNYTKIQLAEMIKKEFPSIAIEIHESKTDPRNYKVLFDKIKNNFNFAITKTVSDGISEIVNEIKLGKLNPRESEFSNMSKLTENVKVF